MLKMSISLELTQFPDEVWCLLEGFVQNPNLKDPSFLSMKRTDHSYDAS